MNNEDFEKRMEFILEQQAQFSADIQQLREAQAQTDSVVARLANVTLEGFNDVNAKINALVDSQIRLTESQAQTAEKLRRTDEASNDINAKINVLVDSQIRLTESQSQTAENLRRTDENLRKTDENLRNLIAMVDRYLSERRNGN